MLPGPTCQDTPEKGLAARNVAQQRYSLYAPLRAASACAHGHLPNGIATPRRLNAFRKLWAFEAANPQRLEPAKLLARMRFTLSQGVGALWRAPQLWHEAASWFAKQGHDQVNTSYVAHLVLVSYVPHLTSQRCVDWRPEL